MIYDKKFTNNQQFKSSQSALEFSDSLPRKRNPSNFPTLLKNTSNLHYS